MTKKVLSGINAEQKKVVRDVIFKQN